MFPKKAGGISGCIKNRSHVGTFFDNHYTKQVRLVKFWPGFK